MESSSDSDSESSDDSWTESEESCASSVNCSEDEALHHEALSLSQQPSLDDDDDDDDEYVSNVRLWTHAIPMGLGLCPWAIQSHRQGRLAYKTCHASCPAQVATQLLDQAQILANTSEELRTTLLICPHVKVWNESFTIFNDFVTTFAREDWLQRHGLDDNRHCDPMIIQQVKDNISLVAFHPEFLRWRGLPPSVTVGSVIQAHQPMAGLQKSRETLAATILATSTRVFGQRRILVKFHNDDDKDSSFPKGRHVPINWCVFADDHNNDPSCPLVGPSLPDNAMHQAPYPTIHLIRNDDLARLCVRDVSRVKRVNAKRMMKLGWEGVLQKLASSVVKTAVCEAKHLSK